MQGRWGPALHVRAGGHLRHPPGGPPDVSWPRPEEVRMARGTATAVVPTAEAAAASEAERRGLGPEQRRAAIEALQQGELDVLVVGGGIVGTGSALDAITRGL